MKDRKKKRKVSKKKELETTQILSLKQNIYLILNSRNYESFIIFLIFLYIFTVMLQIIFECLFDNNPSISEQLTDNLTIVTSVQLVTFLLEVLVNLYVYGFNYYLRDKMMLVDQIAITISIFIIFYLLPKDSQNYSIQDQLILGVFRMTRLFLIYRKIQQCRDLTYTQSKDSEQTSDKEKSIEVFKSCLAYLKENREGLKHIYNMQYCIEILQKNKLYDKIVVKTQEQSDKNLLSSVSEKENLQIENEKMLEQFLSIENCQYIHYSNNNYCKKNEKLNTIQLPEGIEEYLNQNIENLDFDVFRYFNDSNKQGLAFMFTYLMKKKKYDEYLKVSQKLIFDFITKIEEGYKLSNPYHNSMHACDVLQTTIYFLSLYEGKLDQIQTLAMMIGASIHDYEHPGTNNSFQTNSMNYFSLTYNDKSVLEMHHLSSAFLILSDEHYNIFSNLNVIQFKNIRDLIIQYVLSTDMSSHSFDLHNLSNALMSNSFSLQNPNHLILANNHIARSADLSNQFKKWDISQMWTLRLIDELFAQGDTERTLDRDISPGMDRFSLNIAKYQINYINTIIIPTFDVLSQIIPSLKSIKNIQINKDNWVSLIDQYEQKLQENIAQGNLIPKKSNKYDIFDDDDDDDDLNDNEEDDKMEESDEDEEDDDQNEDSRDM